ncbi:hypothetical protein LJC07_06655 [Christensenellaceae bacterium OttesenSCG-928-L17]|nr:hypothetical protein [Christensenellaceae bacterium OttesenSCG-928-L17]
MKQILFVCTGNTCRSPVAEALMRAEIARSPVLAGKVEVSSAGVHASEGMRMSAASRVALVNLGVPANLHAARQATKEMLAQADVILTMSAAHIDGLLRIVPNIRGKSATLKAYAAGMPHMTVGREYDIEDPYGQSEAVYFRVAKEIEAAVKRAVARLEREWSEPE